MRHVKDETRIQLLEGATRELAQGEPDWLEWDWKREIERGWQQDPEMQKKPLEFWIEKYRPRKREGT